MMDTELQMALRRDALIQQLLAQPALHQLILAHAIDNKLITLDKAVLGHEIQQVMAEAAMTPQEQDAVINLRSQVAHKMAASEANLSVFICDDTIQGVLETTLASMSSKLETSQSRLPPY